MSAVPTAETEKLYPWVRLDPERQTLRLVATRFPSGVERIVFSGHSLLTPEEVQGLQRIGFFQSRSGILMRDGVKFGAQELRRIFPTLAVAQMPRQLISRIQPRRAHAESIAAEAQREANAVSASAELGTNARGETVWQGDDGRFVTIGHDVTGREGGDDGARFLLARNPDELARCADGFVGQILNGRPQRFSDLRRWAAIVNDQPESGIETTPLLRQWQEAVEAAIVRAMRQHPVADLAAFDHALRLEEGQPAFNARTSSSVTNQQYSTPMPIAVAVQHILGDVEGKSVLEPTIGNGSLISLLRGARITGVDIDMARVDNIKRDRSDVAVEFGDFLDLPVRSRRPDGKFDAIVCNPPFGGIGRPVMMDGLKVGRLDYQILVRSLQMRTDDGLAVYIVGADSAIDSKAGQVSGGSRHLFNWLSDHYQVDVVEVSGALYAKQGSSFPIRMIVVGSKGKNAADIPDQLPVINDHEAMIDWARAMRAKYEGPRASLDADDLVFDAADVIAPPAPTPVEPVVDLVAEAEDELDVQFDADALDLPGSPVVAEQTPAAAEVANAAKADENSYQSPYIAQSQIGEASAMIPTSPRFQ